MTDTVDTFTDTTTISDTSPPWVNISNDRVHLQKECPGWNAAIPSWSDIFDNISSSLVDVSQRPRRMTDTFTDVPPPQVDVPGGGNCAVDIEVSKQSDVGQNETMVGSSKVRVGHTHSRRI